MPPSSSAAARSDEDDDDHAPSSPDPPAEISNNDEKGEAELEEVGEQEEDGNNNDDYEEEEIEIEEEEYEEIEVEEEEEIEEEIEVEEDEDEEEVVEEEEEEEEEEEGDMLDSSSQLNEKRNDFSQDMELEGNDRQLGSCFTPGKSELGLPSNSLVEDSVCNSKFSGPPNEQLPLQEESNGNSKCLKSGDHLIITKEIGGPESVGKKDAGALVMKKSSKEISEPLSGSKVHLCDSEVMAAETTRPSSITENVPNALGTKGCSGTEVDDILYSKEELKPIEMQPDANKEQTASRLFTSEIRTRSLSPSAEFKDRNKRPAVVCDFFAKGWCIRGNSCRFLHLNKEADKAKEQLEGDAAAANFSKGDQFNEGLGHIIEKPKLPGFPDLMAPSKGNEASFSCHFSTERKLALENAENRSFHQLDDKHKSSSLLRYDLSQGVPHKTQQFPSSKDDLGISSFLKDVGIENLRRPWPATDHGSYTSPINKGSSPSFQNTLLPEHRSSSSGLAVTSINYRGGNLSSYLSSLDSLKYRGQYVHSSSFDGSLPCGGILTSHQVSAWTGPSLAFSSSLDTSPLGPQKLLDSDRHYRTSRSSLLLQSASPLSGPERENLSVTSASGVPLHYAEYKAKISSNDWEPSVPFQPSFFINHTMTSSPGNQYDPLRDSIDFPATGNKLPFNFSFVRHETPILDTLHQPAHDNPSSSHTLRPEHNDDKSTSSFHSRFHENVLDKNCYAPRKDVLATGTVIGGTCVVNGRTITKEEDTSSTSNLKDVPNMSKNDADRDPGLQNDGPRHIKDLKVGRVRQKNEMDVDQKTDGESRTLRYFRLALVDFVKELLKPTWREGHLSKDAHNKIVKKAVEKVLSTLQPHQIPTTMELIKQYLSSSQPKIAKLVEGYCTKYGKS